MDLCNCRSSGSDSTKETRAMNSAAGAAHDGIDAVEDFNAPVKDQWL